MSVFTDVQWRPKYVLKIELPYAPPGTLRGDFYDNLKLQGPGVLDPEWKNAHWQKMYQAKKKMERSQYVYNEHKDSGFDIYIYQKM